MTSAADHPCDPPPPTPNRRAARDVYIYFDNDARVHAPFDAIRLTERLA